MEGFQPIDVTHIKQPSHWIFTALRGCTTNKLARDEFTGETRSIVIVSLKEGVAFPDPL